MLSNLRAKSKDESLVKTLCAFRNPALFNITLREDAAISLPRVFVSLGGLIAFFCRNFRRLLAPALVDRFQTPFGAAPRGADRLVADDDEDRIGVRRDADAQRDPTAALDPGVERHVANCAVGDDLLFIYRHAINDQFDHHFARRSDARAFQIPERL